ncbi:MAG: TetR/AcrR family transcriptional regulator [Pseudomonadota bacterium]
MGKDQQPSDTRERFIQAATRLFSERGFYGASMDQIAREVGLTKQAMIHHFGTKEKLYGAVLEDISERLMDELAKQGKETPVTFPESIQQIFRYTRKNPLESRVLMRELLDNRSRTNRAGRWYLKPFLDRLNGALKETGAWHKASDADIAARVYQLLGAISYFEVSTATLEAMYSSEQVKSMTEAYPELLAQLADLPPGG